MDRSLDKLKLAVLLCALLVASWFVLQNAGVSARSLQDTLSLAEQRGKQIYTQGDGGKQGDITALLGRGETDVPATAFACANCHGLVGEGTSEGGLRAPSLVWDALTTAHTSALTGRERIGYDEQTLARAIRAGVAPAGVRLHPGMPLYQMTDEQMSDLIAYLKKLGREVEPGVSEATVKVGVALPLSGSLTQIGEDIKATLAACFAEVNAKGGVYGRRIELIIADSRGESAGTIEAMRRLVEQDNVFALVGSFEPQNSVDANEYLKRSGVPLVGPVTLSPRLAVPPNRFVFYLLPTFADQARTLVDFANTRSARSLSAAADTAAQQTSPARFLPATRVGVISYTGGAESDALAGLRAQVKLHSMEIVFEQSYQSGGLQIAKTVATLARAKPEYVFFFGDADEMANLAREMDRVKLNTTLLGFVVMLGREAFNLPPDVARRTWLAYPSSLPNQNDFGEFLTVMQRAGVPIRNPAFQTVAYGAAKIFVEAIKLSTRQLSRATLIDSLEQLRDFRTGVMPPVTFNPNRRVGNFGSYVVGINLDEKQYVPLSERLVPRGNP